MPAITETSQAALRARYRHERRIEMAYEEHRYHDTRRWMIAKETLGRDLTYIVVKGKFKAGKQMSAPYHHDESIRSEEHTSELQSLMRISYAVFCLKKKKIKHNIYTAPPTHSHKPTTNILKHKYHKRYVILK